MVIDELIVIEDGEQKFVDSADNKVIDVINYDSVDYHFAKENEVTDGVCDNAVAEPIIDLQISGNSVQESRLPSEYQEVEYLEGTGTQYIVLDYIASNVTRAKGKFQITDTSKAGFLFGSRNASGSKFYGLNWGGGVPYTYYNSYYDPVLTTLRIDDQIHTFHKDKGDLYVDDVLISSTTSVEFTTPSNMNIFACYSNNANGYLPPYARIYNLQFYDNDILMVDLKPCYRKSDNIAGMYDIENNKFYTNAGTGTFVIGSNVPTPETPIEVESVGERTINLYNRNEQKNISTNTAYIGLDMRDWADDYYTLQIKLKEGKEIPADVYFGFIYLNTAAYWLLSNGSINTVYNGIVCASIENGLNGVCCFPSDKLNLILDAFDVFLVKGKFDVNTIPEYEPYGYKVPVKVSSENLIIKDWTYTTTAVIKEFGKMSTKDAVSTSYLYGGASNTLNIVIPSGTYVFNAESATFSGIYATIVVDGTEQIWNAGTTKTFDSSVTILNIRCVSIELPIAGDYYWNAEIIKTNTTDIYLTEPLRKIG